MYQTQKQRAHRPASQDVGKNLVSNNLHVNQPTCNLAAVNRPTGASSQQMQQMHQNQSNKQASSQGEFAARQGHSGRQNNTSSGTRNVNSGTAPLQQAHSQTRDLGAMGLLTQVKKGDDVRTKKGGPRQGGAQAQQQTASAAQASGSNMANKQQPPKLNLNMANQQLANQQMYYLLKPQAEAFRGRKTLLLDVDETLVHSTFTPTDQADIILPIDIEGRTCNIYVQVRPKCCEFIVEMGKYYEVVIFTASLSKYAIPLMDMLDPERVAPQRLFREHCTFFNGQFVKDMQRVGRRMEDIIIIDNSPNSYQFQPENGLPILSWYDDPEDEELMRFVPGLKLLAQVDDVRPVILQSCFDNEWNCELSIKICESLLILKYKKQKQEEQERQEQQQLQQEQQLAHEKQQQQQSREESEASAAAEIKKNNFFNQHSQPGANFDNESTTMMQEERESSATTDQKLQEPAKILAQQNDPAGHQNDQGRGAPRIAKKEVAFSGSNKKSQPKQARSSSKPKTYEVNQGVVGGNQTCQTQRVLMYQDGQDFLSKEQQQQQSASSTQIQADESNSNTDQQQIRFIRQTGPKIQKEPQPMQILPNSKPHNIRQSPRIPPSNQPQTSATNDSQTSGGTSKMAKKVVNQLNPEKLKQYLLTSQQQQQEGESTVPQQKVAASRNQNDGHHMTGSHRNLHTVGHLMMKQSSLQARNGASDPNQIETGDHDGHARKNANVTFTTGAPTSKTLGMVSGALTTASQKHTPNTQQTGSDVRSSIKNGSKRRANSNHATTQDKKVNLDKFLSVVQHRSNYTPSNQTQARLAASGIAHLYKPNNEEKKSYNTTNLTMNQSRNMERKKITQMRLGHNASDLVFAQKKLSLKADRDNANKTSGVRGIQLNQNDIVFSKTMNLSQFLSQQTKSIANPNGSQTVQNQQNAHNLSGTGPLPKNSRAPAEISSQSARQAAITHKRQKSGNNSQSWSQQNNSQQLGQLQSKSNPYISGGNSNTIQQLIQGQTAGNSTSKYANSKLNGSHQSLRNNGSQSNSQSINQKRMSAGNINNVPSKAGHASSSLNSRQQNGGRIKSGGKKINQSSSVQPSERDPQKVQALMEEGSQQYISVGQPKAHSLTRSNRDYQRSPGKIFHGNQVSSGAQALISQSSHAAKNNSNKAMNFVKQQQQNQLASKRSSKPQLMSELTLSLKNKKNNQAMAGQANARNEPSSYANMIKPLVSGRGPQTTKHTPGQMDNFSGRSYTQRVGAANAAQNVAGSNFASSGQLRHHHMSKAQALQQARSMGTGAQAIAETELENQGKQATPRKKIIKLVQGQQAPQSQNSTGSMVLAKGAALASSGPAIQGSQTAKNAKKPTGLDANQSSLLNNYYQSYQRQMQETGANDVVGASNQAAQQPPTSQQYETKQRQHIYSNMMNDYEKGPQFNKEQTKAYNLSQGNPAAGSAAMTNASAKMENLAQISSKKPHSKTRYQTQKHD